MTFSFKSVVLSGIAKLAVRFYPIHNKFSGSDLEGHPAAAPPLVNKIFWKMGLWAFQWYHTFQFLLNYAAQSNALKPCLYVLKFGVLQIVMQI